MTLTIETQKQTGLPYDSFEARKNKKEQGYNKLKFMPGTSDYHEKKLSRNEAVRTNKIKMVIPPNHVTRVMGPKSMGDTPVLAIRNKTSESLIVRIYYDKSLKQYYMKGVSDGQRQIIKPGHSHFLVEKDDLDAIHRYGISLQKPES